MRLDEAIAEWGEAEQGWKRIGYGPGRIQALGTEGRLLFLKKSDEGGKLLDRALRLGQQEQLCPLRAAEELLDLGKRVGYPGELDWTKKLCPAAFEIQDRLVSNSITEASNLQCLGGIALFQGDLEAAKQSYERARVTGGTGATVAYSRDVSE